MHPPGLSLVVPDDLPDHCGETPGDVETGRLSRVKVLGSVA
jgi:hypothetical protein